MAARPSPSPHGGAHLQARNVQHHRRGCVSDSVLDSMTLQRPDLPVVRARSVTVAGVAVEAVITEAYDELAPRLRAFAIRATRDAETADDLVQEAFLRLVVELGRGSRPDQIGAWLYRIIANLIVSRARKRATARRFAGLFVDRRVAPSPEQQAVGNERDRILALALSKLPADARVALLLAGRGMATGEIGIAIGRTPGATRTYVCRSRLRLREILDALGFEGDRP